YPVLHSEIKGIRTNQDVDLLSDEVTPDDSESLSAREVVDVQVLIPEALLAQVVLLTGLIPFQVDGQFVIVRDHPWRWSDGGWLQLLDEFSKGGESICGRLGKAAFEEIAGSFGEFRSSGPRRNQWLGLVLVKDGESAHSFKGRLAREGVIEGGAKTVDVRPGV